MPVSSPRPTAASPRQAGARGLTHIPDTTRFVAAFHNTCDDGVEWQRPRSCTGSLCSDIERLVTQVGEAYRAHAADLLPAAGVGAGTADAVAGPAPCRRRANDLSQARPELGHATNAAASSAGARYEPRAVPDRRVFLISYDPLARMKAGASSRTSCWRPARSVRHCPEYYFSSVDNERYGWARR